MAAVLTGTPTAVTWAAGANPAAQNITIPSDATAVYMFWTFYTSADGNGLASVTLNGASPAQTFETPTAAVDSVGTGVAAWYNPATGTQSLDPAWDAAPEEGATCVVVYVKGGDTTAWRDADAANEDGTTACTVTLTSVSGDLVIKYDQHFDASTPPSLSASWTNGQTAVNNNEASRLSYISASGTTTVCNSENDNYSSICAISIPAGATNVTLTAEVGTFAFTGIAALFTIGRVLTADAGAFAFTGQDASFTVGTGQHITLTADAGSFSFTGQDATFSIGRRLTADAGAFPFTGQDAAISIGRRLTADAGSFAFTGITSNVDQTFQFDPGAFPFTGQDANFSVNVAGAVTLSAEPGAFPFTGQDASIAVGRLLTAEVGTFAFTGQDAAFSIGRWLTAEAGSFNFTGQDAAFVVDANVHYTLDAESGAFSFTGQDAAFVVDGAVNYTLTAEAGHFPFTGQVATFLAPSVGPAPWEGGGAGGGLTTRQQDRELFDRLIPDFKDRRPAVVAKEIEKELVEKKELSAKSLRSIANAIHERSIAEDGKAIPSMRAIEMAVRDRARALAEEELEALAVLFNLER